MRMNFVGKCTRLERIKQIRLGLKNMQTKKSIVFLSNLNNKIFNSETDNCTNIKKQSINICSDTNVDKSSINVFENFSSIENNDFKQFDVPFHENLKNCSNMKAYPNTMTMKIIQCHLYHEAWPHKMTKRTNFKKTLKL